MTQDPRWTPEAPGVLIAAIRKHTDQLVPASPEAAAHVACNCGEFTYELPTHDWAPVRAAYRRHQAEAVLAALADAGLLVPAGGEPAGLCTCGVGDGDWPEDHTDRCDTTRTQGWESVAALQAAYADMVAMLHAAEAERDQLADRLANLARTPIPEPFAVALHNGGWLTPEEAETLRAERDEAFARGVDEGSAGGWWDAAVSLDTNILDQARVWEAPEAEIAALERAVNFLKETDHSAEGYRKFREAIAREAAKTAEAERDAMLPVVEAATALVADWRANRATHGGHLTAAVDTLNGAQPCICNPTHRTNDPICQHRPAVPNV